MMKTKQLTRLWSLMLLLLAMLVPSLAWAQDGINIDEESSTIYIYADVTITTRTDWSTYNRLYIYGTLTINERVTLTVPKNANCSGTVNNYGTFKGTIMTNEGTVNNYGGTISFSRWTGSAYVDVDMNTHVWSEWTITEAASTTQFGTAVRTCPGDDSHAAHSETRIRYKLHDASIAPSAYTGTSATPQRITASNYADYGFTASNYQLFENWYAITSAEELIGYTSLSYKNGNNAILLNDIVINADSDDTYTWTPKDLLYNTFDGAGHTISGLKVDISHTFAGLFDFLKYSAVVKNLGIINSTMTNTSNFAGGIAGGVYTGCTITNCYVMNVAVRTASSYVGGITGYNEGGTVSNCFAVATVNGNKADIIAPTFAGGTNTNCYGATTLAALEGAATGELCYKLNSGTSDGTQAWYQAIGTDTYPVLSNTGSNTVYFGYADCTATEKSIYSNDADDEIHGKHLFDNHGYCKLCGLELSTVKNFVLTDGETYNRTTQCAAETLTYSRTFSNTNWQALYVPFSMDYEDYSDKLEIAWLNDTHMYDDDGDNVPDRTMLEFFIMDSGKTEPNTPYLVRAKQADSISLTLDSVDVYPAQCNPFECSTFKQTFTVYGTYTGVTGADMVSNHYYAPANGKLSYANSTSASLKPQRWYLKVANKDGSAVTNLAASIRMMIDGEMIEEENETGIDEIARNEAASSCYMLDGRAVASPVKPGIYVRNNKKMIVR